LVAGFVENAMDYDHRNTFCVAPAKGKAGYSWIAAIEPCGRVTIYPEPIQDQLLDAHARVLNAGIKRTTFDERDRPFFGGFE